MCLALACASRSAASTPAGAGGTASRWVTWNGLAAAAVGTACAMKAVAWLALPVLAAMIVTREGPRVAARFIGAAAATAVILTVAFAPGAARSSGRVRRQHHRLPARADAPPDPGGQPPARPPTGKHRTRPPGRPRPAAGGSRRGRSVARPATTPERPSGGGPPPHWRSRSRSRSHSNARFGHLRLPGRTCRGWVALTQDPVAHHSTRGPESTGSHPTPLASLPQSSSTAES